MENHYTVRELDHYFNDMREDLKEIKAQTYKTNGRVTSLEKSRTQIWTAISVGILVIGTIISLAIMAIDSKIEKGIQTALENNVANIQYAE